jgi:hypothetical protein
MRGNENQRKSTRERGWRKTMRGKRVVVLLMEQEIKIEEDGNNTNFNY